MVDLVIIITTYNRPALLLDLLKDLHRELDCEYKIKIYNDHSTEDYSKVKDFLKDNINNYEYIYTHKRHNRFRFWELHQRMYAEMVGEDFKYFIQLLDDMRLVKGFYKKAVEQFEACGAGILNIMLPIALNTLLQKERCPFYHVGDMKFWRKKWNDLCFITTRDYFENIGWTCPAIPAGRWKVNPNASSGVGTALTHAYKGDIVIVGRSLLQHTGQQSQMKPHRKGYYALI